MIYGYARVSTTGQTLDAQKEALKAAGAEKIFAETESGAKTDRAQLAKLMAILAPGDAVLITRGTACGWKQTGSCRKFYAELTPPSHPPTSKL